MSIWQTGELYLIPCINDHDVAEKYKVVRNHGFERVHFMVNCSAEQMLHELVHPTQFENPNLDYYCSLGQDPEQNLEYETEDGEVISFVDDQLLCNDEPMCEECFIIGKVVFIKHCSNHHKSKPIKRKRNEEKGCECGKAKQPVFNLPGEKVGIWCKNCKPPNAVNVKNKLCVCGKAQPSFNLPGEKVGIWCVNCDDKPSNAIDVVSKKCVCGKARPSFNLPGEKVGIWCVNCEEKPLNAINIISKRCVCGKAQPIFNLPGEKGGKWCDNCGDKPVNAMNVKDRKCPCGKRPIFNLPGEKIGLWCANCEEKPSHAIDVVNKKCECGKAIPKFNLPGETIGKWCDNCEDKPANAINVRSKMCVCGKARPNFNLPGEKIAIWCDNCEDKPENAINVLCPRCVCGLGANFNIPGQTPKYCGNCRTFGMVVRPKKQCIVKKCKQLAIFGIDKQRLHCEEHKTEEEYNLVERKCESCGLMDVLDNNNICRSCDPTNFQKYIKRKEYRIKDLLDAQQLKYVHDKIPNGTKCGRERPDFVFKFVDRIVILEVDENQHKSYPEECEKIRMLNITQSFGGIPVFWIRYNPDDFKTLNEKRKSTITQNAKEQHLIDWLKWSFQREMKNLGEVVYLFYDGCKEKTFESDISVLIPFEVNIANEKHEHIIVE
jgi:hypothetical protein